MKESNPPYPLVDVLRAFAALLVVAYHVIESGRWSSFPIDGPMRIFRMGWIGVDCFFVISGFVITLSALKDLEHNPIGFRRRFAIRRLARIAPLYFLTSLVFVFVVQPDLLLQSGSYQLTQLFTHLFFIHNLYLGTAGAINGPTWSIGLEMQFYVLIMLIAPWLAKVSIPRMLLVLTAVAWSYRYLLTLILEPGTAPVYAQVVYTTQLPGTIDQFGIGMAIGLAVARQRGRLWDLLQPGWSNFALWAALGTALWWATWEAFWPRAAFWYFSPMIVFWRSLLSVAFACWIAALMTLPIASLGLFKPFRYLGEISYGVYLWHMPVLISMLKLQQLYGGRLLGKVLLGAIALAMFCWHFFERPLLLQLKASTATRRNDGAPG